jgi:hypothetical protein
LKAQNDSNVKLNFNDEFDMSVDSDNRSYYDVIEQTRSQVMGPLQYYYKSRRKESLFNFDGPRRSLNRSHLANQRFRSLKRYKITIKFNI